MISLAAVISIVRGGRLAYYNVNSCEVKIKHPTQPNSGIVSGLLFVVVVANAKIIRNIKQIFLIRRRQISFNFRLKIFENVSKVSNSLASIVQCRAMTPKPKGRRCHTLRYHIVANWNFCFD